MYVQVNGPRWPIWRYVRQISRRGVLLRRPCGAKPYSISETTACAMPSQPVCRACFVRSDRYVNMYVLQVPGGRERAAADLLQKLLGDAISECFVPLYEAMRRVRGEWRREALRLFPGYVFVTTSCIEGIAQRLGEMPFFVRVVGGSDERYVPLAREEVAWLEALTNVETHTVEFSEGVIEGDEVKVTKGPLKGQEAKIVKIDRHRRLAFIEMRMFGRTKVVKVGLEIVSKK